jgi:cation-transporting ATPase E
VLVFAFNPDIETVHDDSGQPCLPALVPLAVVALADELRAEARETIAEFARLGIQIKIISGDDPQTVAALARQAGVGGNIESVTGAELARMSEQEFAEAVAGATVFGRIAPRQKEQIVEALIGEGHRVAMIGDGVNDVLALKKAQLGIAMQSGSPAARGIADIVLVGDSFASLMPAFHEGQRIVGGMQTVMALFLARVSASILMIIAITMLGLSFPFEPAQVATSLFTVGIPALLLAVWAKPVTKAGNILPRLVRFVVPSAIVTMIVGIAIYTYNYNRVLNTVTDVDIPQRVIEMFERVTGIDYANGDAFAGAAATIVAQSTLTVFIAYTAFALILFVEPPFRFFTGWQNTVSADRRPTWLALALSVVFFAVVQTGPVAAYFGLIPLAPGMLLQVAAGLIVWTFALREIWRRDWFDRFLGAER